MADAPESLVPADVIKPGGLPPLKYRDLPEPVPLRRMLGPSIILAGLALGSGEFILWPFITANRGFVFFWACLLGVATQYFINMEVTRWTLATGESAVTGFCRLSKHWAWVFLLMNVIPWMIPAWASGAADMISWLIWGPPPGDDPALYRTPLAIGGLFACGLILTLGPVVYRTVETMQVLLVSAILVLIVIVACLMVRGDAVVALVEGSVSFQLPRTDDTVITTTLLLGALAFAGAGGTTNLGQSNYIKDKGYGMGRYIGRITSPITGQDEAVVEFGYHFPDTEVNLARWKRWWRAASVEHFFSFFLTCIVCLVLLALISYSVFYNADGTQRPEVSQYANDLKFVLGEADAVQNVAGAIGRVLFLLVGVAILLTTEFGLLDVTSRISTDLVKANWLRENQTWSESRLYYAFLWGTILLGSGILWLAPGTLALFKITASLNGVVMFLYCGTLLYLNRRRLPPAVRINGWRIAIMIWGVLFFGFFTVLVAMKRFDEFWNWATG